MNNTNLLKAISSLAGITSARFASFTYTAKGSGEIARHTVLLGASYRNAYQKDLAKLTRKVRSLSGIDKIACEEIITSLKTSLESWEKGEKNPDYTCKETYHELGNGLLIHKETGDLHIKAFTVSKVVLQPGEHKLVNSSEKTLAKKAIEKTLRKGKIRQFVLSTNVSTVAIEGKTLLLDVKN